MSYFWTRSNFFSLLCLAYCLRLIACLSSKCDGIELLLRCVIGCGNGSAAPKLLAGLL